MNSSTDCEHVRLALMASLDGESDPLSPTDRQHLSTCASCQRWLGNLQSIAGRLQGLDYPSARVDLWASVEDRIRQSDRSLTPARWFWPIGATLLVWRALELLVDLPIPVLHPLVPLLATAAAVWLIAKDPLAIETSAPELEN